jgi:hypothetical protein
MAHEGLRRFACALAVATVIATGTMGATGCGDGAQVQAPTRRSDPPPAPPSPEYGESTWGKYHSQRFQLTLPLPDGKAWRIDDHTSPHLAAEHTGTSSKVSLYTSFEHELVNHAACEERARVAGYVAKGDMKTVESVVTVGPDGFDSRIWVAIETQRKGSPLVGHVFLFGAFIRKCLFVHLQTEVKTPEEEPKLSARLASARVTMIGELKMDPPRTADDVELPREKAK